MMLLKVTEKAFRLCLAYKGDCYIICLYCVQSFPIGFIKACICPGFIKSINIQRIVRRFILHNIVTPEKGSNFVFNADGGFFFYDKQIYF